MNVSARLPQIGRSLVLLGIAAFSLAPSVQAQATLNRLFINKPNLVLGPTSADGSTWLATSQSGNTTTLLRAKGLGVQAVYSRNGSITPREISTNGEVFTFQTDTYSFFTYTIGVVKPFTIPGGGVGDRHVAGALSEDGSAIIGTRIPLWFASPRSYYIRNGIAQEITDSNGNRLHLTHISGDGLTVFGRPRTGSFTYQTMYWSQAGGLKQMHNITDEDEIVLGPSTNGKFSVIAQVPDVGNYFWLEGVDGGTASFGQSDLRAIAMSLDGKVVTGYKGGDTWRWEMGANGWQTSTLSFIDFPGYAIDRPTAISRDGKYIAGRGINISFPLGSGSEAYLYSVADGIITLKVLLTQNGVSTSSWSGFTVERVDERATDVVLLGTANYLGVRVPYRATVPKVW